MLSMPLFQFFRATTFGFRNATSSMRNHNRCACRSPADDGTRHALASPSRFCDAKYFCGARKIFPQGALPASASRQSRGLKTVRPRIEYEACRSNAQSTIIL